MARTYFEAGDTVRFKQGRQIDWEVLATSTPARIGEQQKLILASGMSGRRITTTADNVVASPNQSKRAVEVA